MSKKNLELLSKAYPLLPYLRAVSMTAIEMAVKRAKIKPQSIHCPSFSYLAREGGSFTARVSLSSLMLRNRTHSSNVIQSYTQPTLSFATWFRNSMLNYNITLCEKKKTMLRSLKG